MSSKPDGNDPRVLTKEGELVLVPTSTSQHKEQRYHTRECYNLAQVEKGTKEIDVAIAKWKNMEPCRECHNISESHTSILDGGEVDRIRRILANTETSCVELADYFPVKAATIRSHARRRYEYSYKTSPKYPPVKWEKRTWVWAE